QHRALWLRDKQCTFPGCTIPPQWCDAHHVDHWVNGGPTDLSNGALLCQRHHTYVHTHDLTATVTDTDVTWHTWHTCRPRPAPGRIRPGPRHAQNGALACTTGSPPGTWSTVRHRRWSAATRPDAHSPQYIAWPGREPLRRRTTM